MRRKDREVTDLQQIEQIIAGCKVCHVAMADQGMPYIVPMNFGHEMAGDELALYFHCAKEGRKLDILKKNDNVCFELCIEGEPVYAKETPCNSGYYYQSVIGNGKMEIVSDVQEKCKGLSLLLKQVAEAEVVFGKEQADTVCVLKITSRDFTGKRKQPPEVSVQPSHT